MQPHIYTTERAKTAFISLLTGGALSGQRPSGPNLVLWTNPLTVLLNISEKYLAGWLVTSNGVISVNDLSINDYALQFRTLSAASGWNERSLLTTYRQGFEPGVRLQLSAYNDSYDLERSIQLSIRCASRMQFCFMESKILPVFHSFDTQWLSALQNQATKPWKLT